MDMQGDRQIDGYIHKINKYTYTHTHNTHTHTLKIRWGPCIAVYKKFYRAILVIFPCV